MCIGDDWYVVRALQNGEIQIDNDERSMQNSNIVAGMSVYAAKTEEKAVRYLRKQRPNADYNVTQYKNLKRLKNFGIQEDFAGGNKGHYLISGITIADATNKFSQRGKL